jgi:hypothetical protein
MTSSLSSSSSARAIGLLLAGALSACSAARPQPERPAPPRLALYPVQNLTGGAAPVKELTAALRAQLLTYGVVLVPDEIVLRTLAVHRIRYTGGVDRETAAALRDEAGADGVIIPSLEVWQPTPPFRMAMTTRVVSTGAEPAIQFIDAFARTGVDAPGLLAMNVIQSMEILRDESLLQTAMALARSLQESRPIQPCPEWGQLPPNRTYRSPLLSDPARRTIAVLPFQNTSGRRNAGEVMALRFLAPLLASGTVHVVEPGVVRSELLSHRIGATGGFSVDDARVVLELVRADLVLSGAVRSFEEAAGPTAAPYLEIGSWVLDRKAGQLVWSSTTSGAGDAGVYFFGLGRVTTSSALACTMAKGTVQIMLEDRPLLANQ